MNLSTIIVTQVTIDDLNSEEKTNFVLCYLQMYKGRVENANDVAFVWSIFVVLIVKTRLQTINIFYYISIV